MTSPAGPALSSHFIPRTGPALLQGFFSVALVLGVGYVVRSSRDYGFAIILALLGLGGIYVVRWLSSLQPQRLHVHENGLLLEWAPVLPGKKARSALLAFDQVRSVTKDADLDGLPAYVLRLEGLPPVRLSPIARNIAPLDTFSESLVTHAGLTWSGATARREVPSALAG